MRKPKFKFLILSFGLVVAQNGFEEYNPEYYTEYEENDLSLDQSETDLLENLNSLNNEFFENQYQQNSSNENFGLVENNYEYSDESSNDSEPETNDLDSETQAETPSFYENSSDENFGLIENDYDYSLYKESNEDNESSDYEAPVLDVQESDYDYSDSGTQTQSDTPSSNENSLGENLGLIENDYDSDSGTQTQSETPILYENSSDDDLGLTENDYDYSLYKESNDENESSDYEAPVFDVQESETGDIGVSGTESDNLQSEIDNQTQSNSQEPDNFLGISDTAYDYDFGSNAGSTPSESTITETVKTDEQRAPERQDPITNQNDSQDSVPESEQSNVVNLSSNDIMSCATNRHVVELITSFLTGGQDNKEHSSTMTYGEYTAKFGNDSFDQNLLPEISIHHNHDKTALMEFNFLQLLQTYLLTEKAGNEKKYPLDAAPAPFAKVMCLLMAEDMSNREYLGDSRTINCPNGICQTTWFITPIWGFGCWCNFGQALMSGTGQPVHRADTICRDMQLCLRCAKKDAKNRGEQCDPISQTYSYTATASGFESDCTTPNNGDQCAIDVCCCEQQFLSDLLREVFSPAWVYDASFKHDHGFSVDDNCPFGNDRQESDCCGRKPRRFPYNSTKRDCCKELNVFNPINQVCCSDGSVVSSDSSC